MFDRMPRKSAVDTASQDPPPVRRLVSRLAAAAGVLVAVLVAALAMAPAASAAPRACWSATYDTSISKLNVTQVNYYAKFHWCATNGRVDGFVVDKAYAFATGWTNNAGIDIQPFPSSRFGSGGYDIYLNAWGNKKATNTTVTAGPVAISVANGDYRDFYDITLNGNGTITGTKWKYR